MWVSQFMQGVEAKKGDYHSLSEHKLSLVVDSNIDSGNLLHVFDTGDFDGKILPDDFKRLGLSVEQYQVFKQGVWGVVPEVFPAPKTPDEYMAQASSALAAVKDMAQMSSVIAAEQYWQAAEGFSKLLSLEGITDKHVSFGNYGLGIAYSELPHHYEVGSAKVIAAFSKTIEKKPKFYHAYVKRAKAYLNSGLSKEEKIQKAEADCKKAIQIYPQAAEAYYVLGLVEKSKEGEDSTQRAKANFIKAVEKNPLHADALYQLYLLEADVDKAAGYLERYIQIRPAAGELSYQELAKLYYNKDNYEKMAHYLKLCLRNFPDRLEALAYLGEAYRLQGKEVKALQTYDKAITAYEEDPEIYSYASGAFSLAYHNRGSIYAERGDHEQAIKDYTESTKLTWNNVPRTLYLRGVSALKAGKYEMAVRDFERVIELDPDFSKDDRNKDAPKLLIEAKKGLKSSAK
jgi:tetratricopeptide (TPR) repeat protein